MAKKSKAAPQAVYGGKEVPTFSYDLTNYSELRRGLSPAMRAQTMSKTELRKVDPDVAKRYIDALNKWRTSPQKEKSARAHEITRLEQIFAKAGTDQSYTGNERAELLTANLTIKTMPQDRARMEIRENLNLLDRAGGDWYKGSDYWTDIYYMDKSEWDPVKASDNMLRVAVLYITPHEYTQYQDATEEEYRKRLGAEADQMIASEKQQYRRDLLTMAKLFNY